MVKKLLGSRRLKRPELFCFAMALLFRALYSLAVPEPLGKLLHIYDAAAQNLLAGRGFLVPHMSEPDVLIPLVMYPPGYPVFLALVHGLFGESLLPLRLVHFVIGALTAALVVRLVLLAFGGDKQLALASGLTAALLPTLAAHDVVLGTNISIPSLLLTATMVLWFDGKARHPVPSMLTCALAGICAATAALFRSEFLLVTILFALLPLLQDTARRLEKAAVIAVSAILVLAPWSLRNYVMFGVVSPTAPGTGLILVQTIGKHYPDRQMGFGFHEQEILEAEGGGYGDIYWPDPYRRDRERLARALRFIHANPARYALLLMKNVPAAWFGHRLFLSDDRVSLQKEVSRSGAVAILHQPPGVVIDRLGGLFVSVVVFGFAAMGLWASRERLRALMPLWGAILLFLLAFIPLGALGRYTIPAYLLMIPFSVIGVRRLIQRNPS